MNSKKLLPPPPPNINYVSRKIFLFTSLIIPTFCLILSLTLTSCDEDYKKESVPGAWDNLRNSVWTMNKTIQENGRDYNVTYTIGFYGYQSGPYANSTSYSRPYAMIRVSSNDGPDYLPSGRYYETRFGLDISRTGDKIIEFEYVPENSGGGGGGGYDKTPDESRSATVGGDYWKAKSSFNFSFSYGSLTISGASVFEAVTVADYEWEDIFNEGQNDKVSKFLKVVRQINGDYKRVSSSFNWNEAQQQLWTKLSNTVWTKQGSSNPSVGFYEKNAGPSPSSTYDNYYGYVFLMTPEGSRTVSLNSSSIRDGVYIDTGWGYYGGSARLSLKISVSGNTLTISSIKLPSSWNDNGDRYKTSFSFDDSDVEYTESRLNDYFSGTYTKHPSALTYKWDEGRDQLWEKIKNKAWKKQGESLPSIGFYEKTQDNYYENDIIISNKYGTVLFLTPDGSNNFKLSIAPQTNYDGTVYNPGMSINVSGTHINVDEVNFNITVSGNTMTISNIKIPDRWNYKENKNEKGKFYFYQDDKSLDDFCYLDEEEFNRQYSYSDFTRTFDASSLRTGYTPEQLAAYFNGTYIIHSDDPDYAFNEKSEILWNQIKDSALTRQGSSKPTVRFDNAINSDYIYGTVYFMTPDGGRMWNNISKQNNYGGTRISKNGSCIITDGLLFKITASGNTVIISNILPSRGDAYRSNYQYWDGSSYVYGVPKITVTEQVSGIQTNYSYEEFGALFNGTYTKTQGYDWDVNITNLWNQIKNTAWTKQGDQKPSVGFYEDGKGPGSSYYDGYIFFKNMDGSYSNIIKSITIYTNNYTWSSISVNGDKILISSDNDNVLFDIAVTNNGNTLTISNLRRNPSWHTGDANNLNNWPFNTFGGTYTKTSSDPSYIWN
jgi:hypothetical protein